MIAHGFNRGWREEGTRVPRGRHKISGWRRGCAVPKALGHLFSGFPPLKRWAFLFRPARRDSCAGDSSFHATSMDILILPQSAATIVRWLGGEGRIECGSFPTLSAKAAGKSLPPAKPRSAHPHDPPTLWDRAGRTKWRIPAPRARKMIAHRFNGG